MGDDKIQVLLVEDSPTDALFVQDELMHTADGQFAVTHVQRLSHALKQLPLQHFDVVLLDLSLPDSDGLETFSRIYNVDENMPIVLLTSQVDESLALRALQAGAQDYLRKEKVLSGVLPRVIRYAIERKRSKRELRESEAQLRDLFDGTSDLIQSVATDGRILFINRAWREMLGYSEQEIIALNIFDVIHPDQHEYYRTCLQQHLADKGREIVETSFRTKDGSTISVEGSITVYFEDGKAMAIRGIFRDVTKRNEMMAKLQTLTTHLQNIREEERTSISREIHDELGSMLTVMKMELDWLAKKIDANPMHERILLMHQLSAEALGVTRRISQNLRPSVLDNLRLDGAIEWLAHEFEQRLGISCRLTLNATRLPRLDDRHNTNVFRIIQETLTNVARHAHATAVEIEIDETGDHITIEIRDNGIGISKQQLLNLKSFGIAGMYERIKQLNGELKITGVPTQGSTVQLRIPLFDFVPPTQMENRP
jgi:two-component system sensor histidine kinase UhpB